jgi:hypothetical protein
MVTSLSNKDLDRRYDGPVPIGASYPSDFNLSWAQQCANREHWARSEVIRIGKEIALLRPPDKKSQDAGLQAGKKLHQQLNFAEQNWATFRRLSGKNPQQSPTTPDPHTDKTRPLPSNPRGSPFLRDHRNVS